jgi:hypothetical protein
MSDELSINILELREQLEKRLSDISKITEINDIILLVVEKNLAAVKKDLETIGRGGGTMKIIENSLRILASTTKNPEVVELKSIIKEQLLVLYTGSLETFLSDVIRTIGNTQPDFFKFRTENENITFNQAMLQSGFTLGDAILEHIENKKYSFQDLKSTLDVYSNYLAIELDVEEYKDQLILMAATRHIVVHNSSLVDRKFLKQVRDTVYKDTYKLGKHIEVDDSLIEGSKSSIASLADQIVSSIVNREEV